MILFSLLHLKAKGIYIQFIRGNLLLYTALNFQMSFGKLLQYSFLRFSSHERENYSMKMLEKRPSFLFSLVSISN